MPTDPYSLKRQVERFIGDPSEDDLDGLALAAFSLQFEHIEGYRRFCVGRQATPESVQRWQDIPMIPTPAFKSTVFCVGPPVEVFRSSGTTVGGERSAHHHPFPDLYRRSIDATFPNFCRIGSDLPPMLSLIPSRLQAPDSSLSFMIDHVLSNFAGSGTLHAIGRRGVEAGPVRSWLAARQRGGRPALILATALSLHQCLDSIDRLGLRFRLPAGTAIFETGGFKTRSGEIQRSELLDRAQALLNVPAGAVVREYGMTELSSQAYTRVLYGGDPDRFVCPPWMKVRILDPETLDELEDGQEGMIAVLDLANVGSAVHILTEDLGVAEEGGFKLLGRATGAELRGCSLTAEEFASGGNAV